MTKLFAPEKDKAPGEFSSRTALYLRKLTAFLFSSGSPPFPFDRFTSSYLGD
jgi:hypothetical protein